jgi:NAD(P)-dependent dehydrogenase (short-subunit alcohol dehydrogenase family)
MERLKDKYILITGASQGLGRELALEFARQQAAGISLVARTAERLAETARRIRGISPVTEILPITADLRIPEDIERIAALTLAAFQGRLDVLVNNASILGPAPMPLLIDYPVKAFREVLETNLVAPYLLIQKILPAMMEEGGSIINVTSDAGLTGHPGWGAYGISKFGLEGMSQTWAAELEGTGIRVNWVDPGSLDTPMHRAAEPEEDPSQWANPADVTEVFVYLASDESRDVSGKRFQAQES